MTVYSAVSAMGVNAMQRISSVILALALVFAIAFPINTLVSILAAPDPAAIKVQGPDTLGTPMPVQVVQAGATSLTATQVTGSNTGANTALTANLGNVAGKTTYLTGFQVTGDGATVGTNIQVTVTGTISTTQQYTLTVPAGVTNGTSLIVSFPTPLAASAVATSIIVNVPAFGAGNTAASVAAQGFIQ